MNTQTIEEFVVLHDGYAAPKAFYTTVRQRVENALSSMTRGKIYALKTLYGEDWNQLTDGDRRKAGRCMLSMVKMKLLPLVVAKTRHEYSVKYTLAEDPTS